MLRSSLRRRLRSHIVTMPATAKAPSATPVTKPIESRLPFSPDFHRSAIQIEAANAHSPAISFILEAFGVSVLSIIYRPHKNTVRSSAAALRSQSRLRCGMDEIRNLESLGLVLPSPLYIAGAILFGIVGLVAFKRGRKSSSQALTWTGVAMMLYPYAVSQTWLLWLLGAGLCGFLYVKWE